MLFRLILPAAALLFFPELANAGPLADTAATVIAYSKLFLLVAGVLLVVRVGWQHLHDLKTEKTWLMLIYIVAAPSIIVVIVSRLPSSSYSVGQVAAGGRPWVEYTLAQVGLLAANALASWGTYQFLIMAVFFGGMAVTAIKARSMTEDQAVAAWSSWLVPSLLLLAVFWPGWTTNGPTTQGDVIARMGGQPQVAATNTPAGAVSREDAVLRQLANPSIKVWNGRGQPEVPVVLSLVNDAMDEFVNSIAGLLGDRTFQMFGMANSKQVMATLDFHLGNADLQDRMQFFIWNCWAPSMVRREKIDPSLSQMWSQKPSTTSASFYNPFSPENMSFYTSKSAPVECTMMVKGGYSFQAGAIKYGNDYQAPLPDEVLANIAFGDAGLRKEFGWQNVGQAVAAVPSLRQLHYNNPSSDVYFATIDDALMSRAFRKAFESMVFTSSMQDQVQGRRVTTAAWWSPSSIAQELSQGLGLGIQVASAAKGAAETEVVNLEIPIWMAAVQMILLACFPIILLFALLPGAAQLVGYYLLTLMWSKSYIISWALIANLDRYLSSLHVTTPQQMAYTHVIQQLQLYSPLIMAVVIFGPRAAAQALSRGGGAA